MKIFCIVFVALFAMATSASISGQIIQVSKPRLVPAVQKPSVKVVSVTQHRVVPVVQQRLVPVAKAKLVQVSVPRPTAQPRLIISKVSQSQPLLVPAAKPRVQVQVVRSQQQPARPLSLAQGLRPGSQVHHVQVIKKSN
ncbi:uncharacterized protein LOC129909504 [Episyrphus balteatus]|uniref:uncharacterized protein LOC129909504 n=1 Tax=Episyrphus balteatus TaxID=286459 RepID=UPI0024858349|nr:uncharacterized protein LOC129909504 [Episyrphus balteatus]